MVATHTHQINTGVEASRVNPCPLCNSDHWCFHLSEDAVVCGKTDYAFSGWVKTGEAKDGRGIFAKEGRRHQHRGLPNPAEILPLALDPKTDSPQWITLSTVGTESQQQIEYFYPNPETGEPLGKVVRKQWTDRRAVYGRSGRDTKEIRPWHWSEPYHPNQGDKGWWSDRSKGSKPWPLYRQAEVREAIASGWAEAVFYAAGEQAVETARQLGLTAFCNQGGEGSYIQDVVRFLSVNKPALFVIWPDNDEAGMKTSAKLLKACATANILTIVLKPENIWQDIPVKGDIYDVVAKSGMDTPEFIKQLEEEIRRALEAQPGRSELVDIPNGFDPDSEFVQKARRELYGDKPWICVDGILRYWTGNHYKASLDVVERQRLWHYCNGYPVQDTEGNVKYPYASPSWVKKALEWVKLAYGIDPAPTNPPGLNCTNGVLQLCWEGDKPSWQRKTHDPALYYTYEPVVTYDPDADPEHCDRALEVLDSSQREIFLRTVAASLDMKTVRRYKGRLVRALLLKGYGSNGKDTLREIVAAMYGYQGMTGATLTDFASYDQGRKFPLARLNRSRINWASENANTAKLDKIQSLKAFITGDPLSSEGKGKDEYEFSPVAVALFNVNDTPNLQGTLEAIQSRYGVLTFSKTFKIGADSSKGELEADPRLKYDPAFLRSEVLPAFLNHVLDALTRLMADGIDYSCTQQALENIQAENSHLFQFCQEVGLGYDPKSTVSAGEIWERLEAWYLDNGTLSYEENDRGKKRSLWVDQARRDDTNVKGANQVIARFQNLFPKTKRVAVGKGKMTLQGISFSSIKSDVEPVSKPIMSQLVSQKPLPNTDGEPVTPVFLTGEKNEIKSPDFGQSESGEIQKEGQGEKLTRLAHHTGTARNTASPTASPLHQSEETTAHAPQQPTSATDESFQVGDHVFWDNCPGACAWANPFTLTAIEGDCARLDLMASPVNVSELRRST